MKTFLRRALLVFTLCPALSVIAATIDIQQSGLTFDPAEITIERGTTVQWIWNSGSHTVTSGTGAADPDVGSLFDEPLNNGSPSVSYTFDTTGDFPYFCRPHEGSGMTGLIHVVEPPSFTRIGVSEGAAPSAAYCSETGHYGRIIADPLQGLYVCGQNGWAHISGTLLP